ncbi:MAG: hypothetical protein ACFNYI_04845 [Eubacterium sp.]
MENSEKREISVEMKYNPYLHETSILFNGKKPRINSLVEKYADQSLAEWINQVPEIFRDEMNGYDFKLNFHGTDLDFQELKQCFGASVSDGRDTVEVVQRNPMEGRKKKLQEINVLKEWLLSNPNLRFDREQYLPQQDELWDSVSVYVVVCGETGDMSALNLSEEAEIVNNAAELDMTDLHHTPVIIIVDEQNLQKLQDEISHLKLMHPEIDQRQLFFYLEHQKDQGNAKRFLEDIGFRKPVLVDDMKAEVIQKYKELYPVTDFISAVIGLYQIAAKKIQDELDKEARENETENREVLARIAALDVETEQLKELRPAFSDHDTLNMPQSWTQILRDLDHRAAGWRSRKTKISREEEAEKSAREYDTELHRMYEEYLTKLDQILDRGVLQLAEERRSTYQRSKCSDGYVASDVHVPNTEKPLLSSVEESLIKLRHERMVQPKEDLFGQLLKTGKSGPVEAVREVTWNYQEWRDYARKQLIPAAEKYARNRWMTVKEWYDVLSDDYCRHIDERLNELNQKREKASSQLSEEAQKIQTDNVWLDTFRDKLQQIARA